MAREREKYKFLSKLAAAQRQGLEAGYTDIVSRAKPDESFLCDGLEPLLKNLHVFFLLRVRTVFSSITLWFSFRPSDSLILNSCVRY